MMASAIIHAQSGKVFYDPLRAISVTDEQLAEAVQLIRYGNPSGAIKFIKNSNLESQRTFEADFLMGYAYRLQGDLDEAINYFSKAARQQSLSLPAYFERGNCYLIRKNFSLAVFDYDRAILIDTTFAPAYNNRAYARIRNYGEQKTPTQQLKFARKDMEKVLTLSQNDSIVGFEYYYNLGLLDLYMSEYDLAISSFNKAVEADKSVSKLYYFRGAAFFLARYYDRAREDFSTAEAMGFASGQAPEFLRVLELIRQHEESTGEKVGR
jgi:tetratricopeptide (TPR) repeat protein